MSGNRIRVSRLQALCDPFETSPWLCLGQITRDMVTSCLEQDDFLDKPFELDLESQVALTPYDHARRVAYLVRRGWQDPVLVDVGVPGWTDATHWPLEDGNHRLAAAIYRGDREIQVQATGDVKRIRKLLGRAAVTT